MNGRKFFLNLALGALFFLLIASVPTSGQTFSDTEWRYVGDTGVWIRHLHGQGGAATLTLEKHGAALRYGVTLSCPETKQKLILTWEQGETYGKSWAGCNGKSLKVAAEDWEEVFEPLPPELIGPPSAEIFINPENPQIIA